MGTRTKINKVLGLPVIFAMVVMVAMLAPDRAEAQAVCNVPQDNGSIQDCVNQVCAAGGGTVNIGPGTYDGLIGSVFDFDSSLPVTNNIAVENNILNGTTTGEFNDIEFFGGLDPVTNNITLANNQANPKSRCSF